MLSLLPINSTPFERAIEASTARLADVSIPIRDTWNPDSCPAHVLPWLAWAFGVDEWDAGWPEETKRETIRTAVLVQRRKGTVWAIKRAIEAAGYGNSTLLEGGGAHFYDGNNLYDDRITHGDQSKWPLYSFELSRPISNKQSNQVRRILEAVAPARCHLSSLNFTEAANLYDGVILYDGNFNHGAA
jgi:hypothetical protein